MNMLILNFAYFFKNLFGFPKNKRAKTISNNNVRLESTFNASSPLTFPPPVTPQISMTNIQGKLPPKTVSEKRKVQPC